MTLLTFVKGNSSLGLIWVAGVERIRNNRQCPSISFH